MDPMVCICMNHRCRILHNVCSVNKCSFELYWTLPTARGPHMLASTTVKRTGCVERNRVQTDCSGLSVWWLCIRYILHNNNTDTVLCRKVLLQQCLFSWLCLTPCIRVPKWVFSYLSISSNVTCKYKRFQTVNVHNIIHEICNNLVTMAKNAPVDRIFLQYLKKAQFCLQKVEIKSADCEVQKKPDFKIFTSQDTERHPSSNHDDELDVQCLQWQ